MRERPSLQKRFSKLIEAGCDKDDLEKALWWVVLMFHIGESATPTEILDFFILAETLLPQLEKMKPNLEALLDWRSQRKLAPGFDLLLGLVDYLFPHIRITQQRSRILTIPELLNHLCVLLKTIRVAFKIDIKKIVAHAASVPEVVLFEYVKRATHGTAETDEIMDQIGEFQRLAFEAYGVEGLYGRVYEGQTWVRRYRRFKVADPKMQEVILAILAEFMTQKAGGKDVSLVDFFVDSYSSVVRSQ